MYISRVEIDTNNRQKIRDLYHLGAYHNWVENCFPNELKKKVRLRHLWRIDELNGKKYLLVLSEEKPKLDKLERYGVANTAETKDYDHFLSSLNQGKKYRFKLTANPSYRITDAKTGKSKVVPHITVLQQTKWLLDRSEKYGFDLVKSEDDEETYEMNITSRDWPRLRRKCNKIVKLSRVTFEGLLEIKDLQQFKQAMVTGIGREKAFGMGLLTVIPME